MSLKLPILATTLLALTLLAASPAAGQRIVVRTTTSVQASETAVKAMPLEERPNRLGHFYGNTVRRAQHGRLCVNCGKTDRPVARFFYVTR